MTFRRTRFAVLGVAAFGLVSCGASDAPCTADSGGAPGTIEAPADCAVDSVVALDATGAIQDRALARDAGSAALRAAEHTITAGGHLRMVVFAGDANAVEVIYDDDVPTLAELDETRRGPLEQDLRAALGETVDSALGVSRADPALTRRVRALTRGGTSDIARAVRNAVQSLKDRSGAATVTLVSDGVQASDQLTLARRLQAGDGVDDLGRQLGALLGSADGVEVLQALGLGRLPGRVNQSARRTDQLVQIWKTACEETGAKNCVTTTEL
ncbi:MAG TPA: hypothetical protein VNA28_02845 [Solirubrobacteraceae bacterium]|nr:hypothetical protein [Solirubrobacteraceae bacterium]